MPPDWKAITGSNDKPTMKQKMPSEPKPQARATDSNANTPHLFHDNDASHRGGKSPGS